MSSGISIGDWLTPQLVLVVLILASGLANAVVAGRKNRNRALWTLLGLLLPVAAPSTLLLLSPICTRCRTRLCKREVEDRVCFSCGKTIH